MPFVKKLPIKLTLQEYRMIEQIISDIDEKEITAEEFQLREKVRRISQNIERAIKYQRERNSNESSSSQSQR